MNNAIRNIADDTTRAFAEACYDQNSISDLMGEPNEYSDGIDCKQWGITLDQHREALAAALNDLLHDWVLEYAEGCESNGVDPRGAIAEKFNVMSDYVNVDDEGDVYAGRWLTNEQLADFVEWYERTYN
ncbi:hypothetical protein [Halomonas sp. IOP_31]|uniref:hypothetical protein n=1 Tax=Halomonas sp. IOP_31 TaxID=2876584 RepID=UPI001E3CDE79|nr:hypothetical protein [Halomonas sp. IOP_31]MCD6006890.1 hypothetical protein [Halomonas sp. IOP_31]